MEGQVAPKSKTKRVTIRTVADDAGVSFAAVSKVLRNAYGVSDSLRERVTASMQRLSYRPHAAARGMRGQSYTLGVLLPDLRNPFFADIMSGVNDALGRTQYQPVIGIGDSALASEHAITEALIDRQMDGLLLIAPRMPQPDLVRIAETIPTVAVGMHVPDGVAFDTVNNDDELGARLIVQHLHENGYRNIAFLTLDFEGTNVAYRERGYRAAMAEFGLSKRVRVIAAPHTTREVQLVARHLLEPRNRPEAVFCWTDYVAFQVLSVARELGLNVPRDVAVVGYDNTSFSDLAIVALTSVDQSGQVLGLQAARLLIERIKGRLVAEHLVVTPRLVVRASSSAKDAWTPHHSAAD
jgi:DNA-binding LacI/PurR family transcriptional regulator